MHVHDVVHDVVTDWSYALAGFLHVHDVVHDVVTDWSYALAGFLVSTPFGVSPGLSQQFFTLHYLDSLSFSVQ